MSKPTPKQSSTASIKKVLLVSSKRYEDAKKVHPWLSKIQEVRYTEEAKLDVAYFTQDLEKA